MSDRLCLYSPGFRGFEVIEKSGGCLRGARQASARQRAAGSVFSSTLARDVSARLIPFSCRGQRDQANVVRDGGGGGEGGALWSAA